MRLIYNMNRKCKLQSWKIDSTIPRFQHNRLTIYLICFSTETVYVLHSARMCFIDVITFDSLENSSNLLEYTPSVSI